MWTTPGVMALLVERHLFDCLEVTGYSDLKACGAEALSLLLIMPIWLQALGILWSLWLTASCSGTCRFLVGVCCKTVTRQEWLFTICQAPTPNCNNVLLIKSFGFWYIFLSSRKQYSHQWCSFGLVVVPDLFFLLLLQAKVNVGVLLIKTWRDIGCIGEWSLSTMSCTKQFFSSCILASNQFSALKGDV